MNRNLIYAVIIAALTVSCSIPASAQLKPPALRIGVVNSELLYQSYPEFRRLEEKLQKEVEGWEGERKGWVSMMEKLQSGIADKENQLKAGANTFTDKRKNQLQGEIDSLKMDLQDRYTQQMGQDRERFEKRKAELLSGVLESVNKQIEGLGEAEGYDFIIDSANGTVVYAKNPDDLTDKLLRRLKEK